MGRQGTKRDRFSQQIRVDGRGQRILPDTAGLARRNRADPFARHQDRFRCVKGSFDSKAVDSPALPFLQTFDRERS